MKKGMLISFEGGEACGKTTQIKLFLEYLKNKKIDLVSTREPGGTVVGEEIRQILLHSKSKISSKTEVLLFNACRAQHIIDIVKPALAEGKVVVMDRFFDSTYAYQGFAGGGEIEDLKSIINFAICDTVPDVTFLLDISYDEAMKRKASDENLKNLDRMESKGRQYHEKVRDGYLQLAKAEPERFFVINASQPVEAIFESIVKEFERRYKLLQNK